MTKTSEITVKIDIEHILKSFENRSYGIVQLADPQDGIKPLKVLVSYMEGKLPSKGQKVVIIPIEQ